MIGHGGDGGGEVQIQFAALGVLIRDGGGILKDGGNKGVDVVLGHVVPDDDHRAYGHGIRVHSRRAAAVGSSPGVFGGSAAIGLVLIGLAAAACQDSHHHGQNHEQGQKLFHDAFLFSFFGKCIL